MENLSEGAVEIQNFSAGNDGKMVLSFSETLEYVRFLKKLNFMI